MIILRVIFIAVIFLTTVIPARAKFDPVSVPNNKYGIHIADPNDLHDAAVLVNSSGGDWGYVTIVIQDNDRNKDKWQQVFNTMRSLHIIPIVRIATHLDGDAWVKPYTGSAADWAKFLNSLNWPIENRYVVVYNEPNHANEWGKSINPQEYARILVEQADALHSLSEDFFILPAGFDVSASTSTNSLDAGVYMEQMISAEPGLFDRIDGWTSHSYPNPAFSGSPYATGRGTLRSYVWEIDFLRRLGIQKTLPIFITETGWVHQYGASRNFSFLSPESVAQNINVAAAVAWSDPNIIAVTPFVFSYQGLPFDHFSWKKYQSSEYYQHYYAYASITKTKGMPRQREKFIFQAKMITQSLVSGSTYSITQLLKNEGQSILTEDKEYIPEFYTEPRFITIFDPLPRMEPGQFGSVTMHIETPDLPGTYPYTVSLLHNGQRYTLEEGSLTLVPPPSITIRAQLGWRKNNTAVNAMVLIYDEDTVIHKYEGVEIRDGTGVVSGLHNVVPGKQYRVVTVIPYYLPRQQIVTFEPSNTVVSNKRFYPFDFNLDGSLNFRDFMALFRLPPNFIMSLFFRP